MIAPQATITGIGVVHAQTLAEWAEALAVICTDAAHWQGVACWRGFVFSRRRYAFDRRVKRMRTAWEVTGLSPGQGWRRGGRERNWGE